MHAPILCCRRRPARDGHRPQAVRRRKQGERGCSDPDLDPPPMSSLQPVTPPTLERVVRRCLAKSPDDRWQTARDLGWELKSIAEEGAHATNVVRERKRAQCSWGALIGAGLVAVVSVAAWILGPGDTSPPSYQRLTFRRGIISSARFAPDGQTVIFSAAWDARPYELFLSRSAARNRARWEWRTAESFRCRRQGKWPSFWDDSPFLKGWARSCERRWRVACLARSWKVSRRLIGVPTVPSPW